MKTATVGIPKRAKYCQGINAISRRCPSYEVIKTITFHSELPASFILDRRSHLRLVGERNYWYNSPCWSKITACTVTDQFQHGSCSSSVIFLVCCFCFHQDHICITKNSSVDP